MKMTNYQQQMLDGRYGKGKAMAARILASIGETFQAERFVPVTRTHVSLSAQGADIWFAEKMADAGAVCAVPPTVNPGYSVCEFRSRGLLSEAAEKNMLRAETAYRRLGAKLTYSCTPYLHDSIPEYGEITALSETSVTIYANSVIGARTNRESAFSALCAAITGFTPEYGMLLEKNRFADTVVQVEADMNDDFSYSLLGLMGKKIGGGIPVFCGLSQTPTTEQLINLGTQLNVSGSFEMFHIPGVTPDAPTLDAALGKKPHKRTVAVTQKELDRLRAQYAMPPKESAGFVMLGCPHYTYSQILELNDMIMKAMASAVLAEGGTVSLPISRIPIWVLTSRQVKTQAKQSGILAKLEHCGVHVLADTCIDEAPVWGFLSGTTGLSDSPKCAYYMSSFNVKVKVLDTASCIRYAWTQAEENHCRPV